MNIIVNINSQKFSLNGVPYFKNFMPHVINNYLRIVNCYDSKLILCEFSEVSNFSVNGVVYATVNELQNALLPVLYSRNTLGSVGGSIQELDRIVSLGTEVLDANEVTYGVGFTWYINQVLNANDGDVLIELPLASDNMYRRHLIYLNDSSEILLQVGEESDVIVEEPILLPGTLRLREYIIFGADIINTIGPEFPFDLDTLDELNSVPLDNSLMLVKQGSQHYKVKKSLLSIFNYLKLSIQPADILAWENGTGNLFLTDKRLSVYFGNGISISITANDQNNGSLTLPRVSGMVEIIRSVTNVTNNRDFFDIDTSRLIVLTGTGAKTLTLPASFVTSQLEFQVILKQGTGFIASPTFTVNGANTTIELESNVLYRLKRISTTEFILTPKPGSSGTVPSATDVLAGIMKLYASLGTNTDGSIRQDFFTSTINKIENFFISKQNGTFGSHTGDLLETVVSVDDVVGGFFVPGDGMAIRIKGKKSGAIANVTYRIRFGTTGTTADALIATYTGNNQGVNFERLNIEFLTGDLVNAVSPTANLITDTIGTNSAFSDVSLTYSAAWKITITAQLGNAGETASIKTFKASKTKSI
ncbi:hypothetical protein [Flavobacterium sp.]|uniref:hypothetical protein n=1 Tax=Flavobacterium sp. TaxID=239 RepID=UPI0025BD3015|nr:hypothetical protein [Flavobacterium sp.]MBA4154148.1 hypothetical protein [Flavobacterium sp.]